jgi:putative ABC transport system ATP-binding protein
MIEIEKVYKTFNQGTINEVHALRNINLTINAGEFVTIIGTNGSGKTTLLNAIAGVFLPDTGSIRIDGHDVTHLHEYQRAKHIARVFQNPFTGTAPEMTIAENLHIAFLRGKTRLPWIKLTNSQKKRFRDYVSELEMGLENRLDNIIGSLSGGQRQALTLLMAVLTKPKVLLLDEHTAALDPKSASQVVSLTKKFIERDKLTTVMVTHSMQQALELGNRTIMAHKGEIIDDIGEKEKKMMTAADLLDKFAELRKAERLTGDLMAELRRDYA